MLNLLQRILHKVQKVWQLQYLERVVLALHIDGIRPEKAGQFRIISAQTIAYFQMQIHVKYVYRNHELCKPVQNQNPAELLLTVSCGQC